MSKGARWDAIYAAVYVRQYCDWMDEGRGMPGNETRESMREEAAAVADLEDEDVLEQAGVGGTST